MIGPPAAWAVWRSPQVQAVEGLNMVRHRLHLVADLGKYRDAMAWISEMNAASRKLGLPEASAWSPMSGDFNYIVLETEYSDLASFDALTNKFQNDPQAMTVFRRGKEWGSPSHWPKDEVLVSAPTIA
jgi:hypothetical protein